MEEGPNDINQE